MATRLSGFTRASSLGPIADFMSQQGGSAVRVLRDVDLPFALLERPELVIPLREQFRFLERAARETGDECFGARLGQAVRTTELSDFGKWVCSAETLAQSIERGHRCISTMLQTSTVFELQRRGSSMRWSIEFVEPETEGRRHNELLGISYMIDLVRHYAGRTWRPDVVMCTFPNRAHMPMLEDIFRSNVSCGHDVTSIDFNSAVLACKRPGADAALAKSDAAEPPVPKLDDALASIAAVTDLAVNEGYPRVDWVANKLGLSRRTLQRQLERSGTSFQGVVDATLARQARTLLETGRKPITDIALQLGYQDTAHFTRAFRRWTGSSPSAYRQRFV